MVISVNPATKHISAKKNLVRITQHAQRDHTDIILHNHDNLIPLIETLSRGSIEDSDIKYIIVPAMDIAFLLEM